ncbi:hypothetical protein Tco_0429513, partial [Tanacetum coccineum]
EFWSTAVAYDPFPSTDETEQRPLREFLIKFLVLNGQRPLTLDFNTFCSSTDIDYNNGKYVAHPTPKAVKKDLGKIAINSSYLDKTLVLKNSFPVAWRIMFTFVSQVLGENYSSTKQVNFIQQLLAYCLITGTEVDIGEIIYSDLVTKILNKSRLKYVSYPRFISCALQVLLAHMIAVNSQKDSVSPLPLPAKPKKGKSQTVTPTLPKSQGPEVPGALSKKSKRRKSKKPPTKTKVTPPKPTEGSEQSDSVSSGTIHDPQDLKRNIQLASTGLPSTLDEGTRTAKTTPCPEGWDKDLGGNIPSADMESIHSTVADLSGTGAKYQVDETQSTRLRDRSLTENKGKPSHEGELDTQPLVLSTYVDVRAFLLSDDKAQKSEDDILGAGKEMDEEPQVAKTHHRSPPSQVDKPRSSHAPSTEASDTDFSYDDILKKYENTLPLTERQLVKYLRKVSNTLFSRITGKSMKRPLQEKSEEPKHSTDANIELIGSSKPQPSITQAQPITIINPELIISQKKAKAHIDKEEQIKKAEQEAILFAISKPEVIKVVREEAKKVRIHLKEAITTKAGEKFKKAQDAEHEVLKRQHTKKVKKSIELRKHKFDNYMWTINNRLKPKTITDIKIHLKTKPVVITVFRGTDGRNFDVHKPFAFALSVPAPKQASSKSSRKKRKHMELEPEIKIPRLECNRALPENVSFVNNMVIEDPEHRIFSTDEFDNQAFQRWSDIDKVRMEALVSYLVAVSMVQSPENARFSMKLKKLIAEHPDQEKLKSKKVKLEAIGYEMN